MFYDLTFYSFNDKVAKFDMVQLLFSFIVMLLCYLIEKSLFNL